jgi:hypothetical protein
LITLNWWWLFSGMLRRVVWWKFTDVSEILAASIIKTPHLHDGDSKYLWNVYKFPPDYMAQHPRTEPSSHVLPWEPEISH